MSSSATDRARPGKDTNHPDIKRPGSHRQPRPRSSQSVDVWPGMSASSRRPARLGAADPIACDGLPNESLCSPTVDLIRRCEDVCMDSCPADLLHNRSLLQVVRITNLEMPREVAAGRSCPTFVHIYWWLIGRTSLTKCHCARWVNLDVQSHYIGICLMMQERHRRR
jgi:hypothetical protein